LPFKFEEKRLELEFADEIPSETGEIDCTSENKVLPNSESKVQLEINEAARRRLHRKKFNHHH
jgi:hypothetical protein